MFYFTPYILVFMGESFQDYFQILEFEADFRLSKESRPQNAVIQTV